MLKHVVDIKRWLSEDSEKQYTERLERDRQIGSQLPDKSTLDRVLAWWQILATENEESLGEQVAASRRFAIGVLFIVGLFVGLSLAGVAFAFNGSHPVNLFALFGVLIGIPLLFLCASLIAYFLPVIGVQKFLGGLNLGRWVAGWLDRGANLRIFFQSSSSPATTSFSRWQITAFSQWFSVGYFTGVLCLAWLLVVFTDLAFGWSTTLNIEAASVQSWFLMLSLPWRGWLVDAVPSLALVEASQFYRLEEKLSTARVVQLGAWWPFVMMVIVVYGLIPRLGFLVFSVWRSRVATINLLLQDPEVVALCERLAPPAIAYDPPTEVLLQTGKNTPPETAPIEIIGSVCVVVWNHAIAFDEAGGWLDKQWRVKPETAIEVSLESGRGEQQTILASFPRQVDNLVIFVKGWEPPTLDFEDMLAEFIRHLDPGVSTIIVPIAVDLSAVNKADRDIWAQALAARWPGTYVVEEMS